jgi:hypothetical protein
MNPHNIGREKIHTCMRASGSEVTLNGPVDIKRGFELPGKKGKVCQRENTGSMPVNIPIVCMADPRGNDRSNCGGSNFSSNQELFLCGDSALKK